MAEAYSSYVVESHGGKTRAYVKGWIESETDKAATIYVWGCAEANRLTQYGVRISVYIDGNQVNTATANIFSASSVTNVGSVSGRATIAKGSNSESISIACSISGETVGSYGPIGGSATASTAVLVGAKVLSPPSAPSSLTAARDAAANIELSWTNNASNASSTLIERCLKGGSWEKIADNGSVITSYVDSPGVGSFKYRVRYWNEDGYSGYSNETDYVVTLCAPAAPTLLSPLSGATVNANNQSALLRWQHNSIDSSGQTEAKVYWSTDNQVYEEVTVGAESQYSLPVGQNLDYYWRVATRGAHADYGPASGVSHFLVRTAPVAILRVSTPVKNLPIPISWDYEDAMGTQSSARLEIYNEAGGLAFRKQLHAEQAYTVEASEFTPKHEENYTVQLTVTSTTSLSYTTQATFTADYVPPARPRLAIATEYGKAANVVSVFAGEAIEGVPPTAYISLFREDETIAEALQPSRSFVDETPPLDRQVRYRAVAYAQSGAASERSKSVTVPSSGFVFFNFDGKIAKVGMNLSIKDETKNEKESYATASSKYPKVFYGEHSERGGTITAEVFWAHDALDYGAEAMLSAVEELKEHSGLVHMRLPYSDAFTADVDVTTSKSTDVYNIAPVSIEWRRVE